MRRIVLFVVAVVAALAVSGASGSAGSGQARWVIRDLTGGVGIYPVAINERAQIVGHDDLNSFLWENGRWRKLGRLAGGARSTAWAINDSGEIAGWGDYNTAGDWRRHAVRWRDGQVMDLGTLGGSSSRAWAINGRGQIVGTSVTRGRQTHAFLWAQGKMTDLGTLGGNSSAVASSPDGDLADAISENGQVIGRSRTGKWQGGFAVEHAFLWESGKMTDLGSLGGIRSWAVAINEAAQIVGESLTRRLNPERHAFLWQAGKMTDLGTLGGRDSDAVSINNSGQIVGYSHTGEPGGVWHAFLWENGAMHDLGTAGGKGTWSSAHAINDRGQVIIEGDGRAFVWQDGTMTDLGTLGGKDSYPIAINDRGQVVGTSTTKDGVTHAVLWTPVSG